jgi:hypothetical protein
MADTTESPVPTHDDRRPYEAPALTRHDDWEIVTGSTPSGPN